MDYWYKEDLRFEVLKEISVHGTMESQCELSSAKETLGNAEVN